MTTGQERSSAAAAASAAAPSPLPPTMALLTALLLILLLLPADFATSSPDASDYYARIRPDFDSWLLAHGKSLPDADEYDLRLSVYASNAARVSRHNEAYDLGLTRYAMSVDGPFSDLTDEEFETSYLMSSSERNCFDSHASSGPVPVDVRGMPLPTSVDWRTKGVITPIKSQGICGSCWSFSTTGALEAHHCISHGLDCSHCSGLSEQQLLDCSGSFGNHGCHGGWPSQAMEYIHYSGGIVTEDSYNYTAKQGACRKVRHRDVGARVKAIHNITSFDEKDMVKAVAFLGPVSVAFDVSHSFRFYHHGVYDAYNADTNATDCYSDIRHENHAVVAVGYGKTMDDPPVPFWIVRNSWGTKFGMGGYFWILRGENLCGIADCASYPVVRARSSSLRREEEVMTVS